MKKDLLFIFLITLIWFTVVFSGFRVVSDSDWDTVFGYHESQRQIISKYHQLPLWNPYLCGGEPWLAHPLSDFLSPFFIFVLFFGTISGTIIAYLFQAFIGLSGIYFLSRYYGLNRTLSFLNTLFALNIYNKIAYIGIFIFLSFSFIPWAYLFFNRSKTEKRYILYTAMTLAVIISTGYIYIFVMAFIIFSLEAVFYAVVNKKPKFILVFIGIIVLSLLFSAPRILPMLDLLNRYPRITSPAQFLRPGDLRFLILELQELILPKDGFRFLYPYVSQNALQYLLGIIATFMIFSVSILLWKKYKLLIAMSFIFIFISLADNSPINLWRILHFFLPSMRGPGKFAGAFLMFFALFVGLTINELKTKLSNKRALKFVVLSLYFIFSLSVFSYASMIFKTRDPKIYHLGAFQDDFYQSKGNPSKIFETIYNGQGILSECHLYDAIGGQITRKVLAKEESGYKGEYYLKNGFGQVEQVMFSPNKLVFKLKLSNDDTLVINQNYFPGWHSSVGRVVSRNGLISVALNKKNTDLILYYLPGSFVVGIILFLLSLLLIAYINKQKWLAENNNMHG